MQHYSKALDAAEQVEIDEVTLSALWSNRSATHAVLEDYCTALHDSEKAIEVRMDWSRGYARKAVALVGLNRCQEAILAVKEGLQRDPVDEMLLKLETYITEELRSSLKRKAPEKSALEEAIDQIQTAGVFDFSSLLFYLIGVDKSLPVVVISGFLGSGKTTLLHRILMENEEQRKIAVLVNDMAEINIDAELLKQTHDVSETKEEFIELTNGCVCCTLRGDLIKVNCAV